MNSGKRRRFIINVLYWAIIVAIVYLIFRYLLNLLMPFVIAFLVAWVLRPLCKLYKRKLKHARAASALTVATVGAFYLVIGGLALWAVISVVGDVVGYLSRLPELYTQTIEPGLRELYVNAEELASRFDPSVVEVVNKVLPEVISSVSSAVTSFSVSAVTRLTNLATSVPSFLIGTVICVISTIFTAVSFDSIKVFLKANLPIRFTEVAGYVGASFKKIIMQYGISYLLIMLITFTEISIGLLIIGVKKALLIAAVIALFDIFPIVGAGLILLPWTIISFIQGNVLQGVGLGVLYVVVIILRQIIEPKIIGQQVGLPPLVTLACMFVGTSLFGGLGLFGLPIMMAIIVNLNNDPDVPINLFRAPRADEEPPVAPPGPGKITYQFHSKKKPKNKP